MKKLICLALAAIAVAAVLSGCGHKVEGVPGTVAVVNGTSISEDQYLSELSSKLGERVLSNIIERQILLDWANSLKVGVTKEQVDKQIELLKGEGQYKSAVKQLGEAGLRSEMEDRQARINIGKKLFKITDKELQQQYDAEKGRFVHGPRKLVGLIINPKKARVEEAAKKIKAGMDFDEASDLYSDRRFAPRGTIVTWIDVTQKELPEDLRNAVKNTKDGKVSKVFPLGMPGTPTNYVILNVVKSEPKADKKLSDVKDLVRDDAALLKTQMDPKFNDGFNAQKKKAKIKIDIPQFRGLVQEFKNPPEMPSGFGMQPGPAPGR